MNETPPLRLPLTLSAALLAACALVACDSSSDEEEEAVDMTPIVGLFEIPISRNNQGTEPANALRLEVSPTEIRLDGRTVTTLERGRPSASAVTDHVITPLRAAIDGGAARSAVALRFAATVPYLTLAEVLHTVRQAGLQQVHVAVRTLGNTPTEGWMPLGRWHVDPPMPTRFDDPDAVSVSWTTPAVPWDSYTAEWQAVYDACRAGQYVDCDAPYTNVAQGGDVELELWTRGQGMKVTFRQANAPEPEPGGGGGGGGGVALIEGLEPVAPPAAPEGEGEEAAAPATMGAFTLRHQDATAEESALSATVQPICANRACRVHVVADATGASMRVISLIGAAFPNGFAAPELSFHFPAGD